jgi:hypothetical protein
MKGPHMPTTDRVPFLEMLEPRLFLDGTITVTLAGSVGMLRGDSHDNVVAIVQSGADYTFTPGGGTTVRLNGVNHTTAFTVSAAKLKNLTVDLGAGNDRLTLGTPTSATPFVLTGDVSVSLGSGNNGFFAYALNCRNLTVDGANGVNALTMSSTHDANTVLTGNLMVQGWGSGAFGVEIDGANLRGNVTMALGNGGNMILFNTYASDVGPGSLLIGKNLGITTGASNDRVDIMNTNSAQVRVGGNVTLNLGADEGLVKSGKSITVGGGLGGNVVSISTGIGTPLTIGGSLAINSTGKTYTGIDINDITIGTRLSIVTGAGADWVELNGLDVHGLTTVNTGGGNDDLRIAEGSGLPSYFRGGLSVDTGLGDDDATLDGTYLTRPVTFNGGPGTNRLGSSNWSAVSGWFDRYARNFTIRTTI